MGRVRPLRRIVGVATLAALLALLLLARDRLPGEAGDSTPDFVELPDLPTGPHPTLDLAAARAFFPAIARDTGRMEYDPLAWAVLKPDRVQGFDWPEHADGRITFRTNDAGLREDEPVPGSKTRPRVLVLGDSQTEGVVPNRESWANVLEALLGARDPAGPGVDVFNAGVGGTGPHNYRGQAERLAWLDADVVAVGLYTGNDFSNALSIEDYLSGRPRDLRDRDYRQRLIDTGKRWPEILPQGFNQAAQFASRPDEAERALDATERVLLELAADCSSRRSQLVVVILPSKPDVDGDDDDATTIALLASLQLERARFDINLDLGRRLAERLRKRGIAVVDPVPAMRASPVPCYWRKDHHLDTTGHALVAREVAPVVFGLLRR